MLSEALDTKISNICYANVLGLFAMFHNPKMRGPKFEWDKFAKICEDQALMWMERSYVGRHTVEVKHRFQVYARQYAEKAVKAMTE